MKLTIETESLEEVVNLVTALVRQSHEAAHIRALTTQLQTSAHELATAVAGVPSHTP
jgi:hypothetical protein